MKKLSQVFCLGDIHGELDVIYSFIDTYNITDSSICSVGDFGFNFSISRLTKLQDYLAQTQNRLYINRGNHDNYYNHYPTLGSCEYENLNKKIITFTKDYSIHKINNLNFLFIHGATSIDRSDRQVDINWWQQESVTYLSKENLIKLSKCQIDIIISHTAPFYFAPYSFNPACYKYFNLDNKLETDLNTERLYLNKVWEIIKPPIWTHGHFHNHSFYNYLNTRVLSLGIDEFIAI